MKVTVIFEDDIIVVDGEAAIFKPGEVVPKDPNYRAIQWMGSEGYIEVFEGDRIWLNDGLDIADYIEQHHERIEIQVAEKEAMLKAIQDTIDEERRQTEENARIDAEILAAAQLAAKKQMEESGK